MIQNIAFCTELTSTGPVPDEVQLLPAGPELLGRDGRRWRLNAPEQLITEFKRDGKPLVIDWEHASQHRAPQGLDAPAAGWIVELINKAGAIWGRVDWTARARQQIAAREYRFISPGFLFDQATGAIFKLVHAGLTNQPNLSMTALNKVNLPAPPQLTPEQVAICQALGKDPAAFAQAMAQYTPPATHGEQARIVEAIARATGKDPAELAAAMAQQQAAAS